MTQLELFYRFGAAVAMGLLVGLQREYHYVDPTERAFAGARTYTLLALFGCLAALAADELGMPLVYVLLVLPVGLIIAVAYYVTSTEGDIGTTTEVAALVVLLVGALCYWGYLALAAAVTVTTTVLLSLKIEMRSFVRRLDASDIEATLKFAVITAVILPVLPNEGYGPPPFDVLNPYRIWLMVVFISGINFFGYALSQLIDPRQGIGLTGFLGGLVSSTAVTLSFTERSREGQGLSRALALAVLLAWTIMFGRVLVEVAVVNASLLSHVWLPIASAGGAGLLYGAFLYLSERTKETEGVDTANPFELGPAIKFGLLFGVILLVARSAEMYLGTTGVYLSSVVGGLTDVDAITLSVAQLSQGEGGISPGVAADAIVLAALSNTVVKGGIVLAGGSPAMRRAILPGLLLILITGALVALVS